MTFCQKSQQCDTPLARRWQFPRSRGVSCLRGRMVNGSRVVHRIITTNTLLWSLMDKNSRVWAVRFPSVEVQEENSSQLKYRRYAFNWNLVFFFFYTFLWMDMEWKAKWRIIWIKNIFILVFLHCGSFKVAFFQMEFHCIYLILFSYFSFSWESYNHLLPLSLTPGNGGFRIKERLEGREKNRKTSGKGSCGQI